MNTKTKTGGRALYDIAEGKQEIFDFSSDQTRVYYQLMLFSNCQGAVWIGDQRHELSGGDLFFCA